VLLTDLKTGRYRSIKEMRGDSALELRGLNCLVGKNNAGKTNIMSAVKFLLREEDEKTEDEELFWQRETDETVVVRGFFEVTDEDLSRVFDEKRADIEDELIDQGEHQGQIGIERRATFDGDRVETKIELLQLLPTDDRLSWVSFEETWKEYWGRQRDDYGTTKTTYRNNLQNAFPEVAEHVREGGEKNKGAWESAYHDYVNSYPDDLEYELQPTDFDGTQTVILNELLPEVVSIPAIKPVDSTTKKRGEFGTLISEISSVISDEIDREIRDKLADLDLRENETVKEVEEAVSDELGAAFENQSVRFDFPELSAEYLFDNADIEIDDEQIDSLSKENVGEGVKRTLIFSLVRTLADIREGGLLSDDEDDVEGRPLLLCYEEADLFLHPSLQKQLLRTFEEFADSGDQVLFSTHSPILVQYDPLDTINIVRKDDDGATTVTQFHEVLSEFDERDRSRLTDLQSVSSYVFADRVVLVEGISDEIVFDKLSRRFGPEGSSFRTSPTPILATGGKSRVRQFYHFLDDLGIETYAVLDVDALYQAGGDAEIERLFPESELSALDELTSRVDERYDGTAYDVEEISKEVQFQPWSESFEQLEELRVKLVNEDEVSQADVDILEKVLSKCENSKPPKQLWTDDEVAGPRTELVETLLEWNVLVLSGDLEDYYPNEGGNKRAEALQFDPDDHEKEDLRSYFQPLGETTDVEQFLTDVFEG
jgi:predicted ATP-dependent endonuclease of OLD family